MGAETKNRLILALGMGFLIGFAGQSYLLWQANEKLAQAFPAQDDIPASIEKRLLAELEKKDAARAARAPFGYPTPLANQMPLQDYFDSFFSGFGMPTFSQGSLFPRGSIMGTAFATAVPEIAIDETEEDYRILIPVSADQELELNTNVEENSISVTGVITEKSQQAQNNFSASSFSQRQFAKTQDLPTPVDEFGMTTTQTEAGIEIKLPKKNG